MVSTITSGGYSIGGETLTNLSRIENINKSFGGLQVLIDVSFKVEIGARKALIGPNGAGKTTLFNVISGELQADSGRVLFLDQDITRLPPHKRVGLGFARTFQQNNLFFNLSVRENVLLALRGGTSPLKALANLKPSKADYTRARDILETWGLWDRRSLLVKDLSYGEQRQMELVLGLATQSKLLLLDEPSAGMSPAETATIVSMIASLPRDMTVIIIEHDMDVVFNLADHIVVLEIGQVITEGTPAEVKSNPRVRKVYLGEENI